MLFFLCPNKAVLPEKWDKSGSRPLVLHFAGTGDHYFWRRRTLMAKPMVKEKKVGSIILGKRLLAMNLRKKT